MDTQARVKQAKQLTRDILSGDLFAMMGEVARDEQGYRDTEHYEFELERVSDHIQFILDTPNNTLPSLDRLREAAIQNKLING